MSKSKKFTKVVAVADEVVDEGGDAVRPTRPYSIRLATLANVKTEMAALYREARRGRIGPTECNKLVWALMQLVTVMQAIDNTEQAERLLEIETRLGLAKSPGTLEQLVEAAGKVPHADGPGKRADVLVIATGVPESRVCLS